MSEELNAMLELEKRGKLPEQFLDALAEARNRGLVPPLESAETPEKSWGQTIKENLLGDDDPTTQNFGEKVGSFLNKGGESMTMGLIGDEASAAVESLIPGVDYEDRRDHYRAQEKQFEKTNPGLALTADIGGAMVAPIGALGALGKGASMAERMLASGLATGTMAGTYGFMEGEGGFDHRASDAVGDMKTGAAIGSVIPLAGAGVQKIADSLAGRKAIKSAAANAPTSDMLRAEGRAAYKAIDDAGVSINADSFRNKAAGIVDDLRAGGMDDAGGALSLTPKSSRMAQLLTEAGEGANTVPFSHVDRLRRKAAIPAGDISNKVEQKLGSEVIDGLDDFVANLGPNDVDAGDIDALKTLLPKARDTWSRMSRSQTLDDAIDAAGNYQSGKASGLANQFRSILNNAKRRRGFSDAEQKVMRRVVDGTMPEKIVRYLGSGLGMMGQMGIGAVGGAALGPVGTLLGGAAGAATGAGSRKLSEKIATKNAEIARAIVANGGMKALPKASDATARIIEQLMRRSVAAGPQ